MMIHPTLDRLHELRLTGMATALEEQLQSSVASELSFEERLGLLLERESTFRDNRRLQRLLKEARLRLPSAAIEDIDFRSARGLDRSVLLRLSSADWVRQHQVVLVVGPTGVGKSYLACALGQSACRNGLSTGISASGASSANSPSDAPMDPTPKCSPNWPRPTSSSSMIGALPRSLTPNDEISWRSSRIDTAPRPPS